METNRFALAAWLCFAQAVLMPAAIVVGIVQGIVAGAAFGYSGPTFGPSDMLGLLSVAFSVYALYMFRELLHERYDFHDVDGLISLCIGWLVLMHVGSLALRISIAVVWPLDERLVGLIYMAFMALFMLVTGIIDIIIGVRLLRIEDSSTALIRTFAVLTLTAGIMEATVIFVPLAVLVVPVATVLMGMLFLKQREQVEFV